MAEIVEVQVTTNQLLEVLKTIERGTFSNIVFVTVPKMNKTNNPYFNLVSKITKGNILVGGDYQKRVIKETGNTDFVSQPSKVGEHTSRCVLHNEKLNRDYLEYEWFQEVKPKTEFLFDGNSIEKTLFESYLVKSSPNPNGVQLQTVTVSNIKQFTVNKTRYIVVNE
jgi:hypothetical protein